MRLKLSFFLCLFQMAALFAQDTTQTATDTVYYRYFYQEQFDNIGNHVYYKVDTTLHLFQRYEPVKDAATLGNTGKAYSPLLFDYKPGQGFDLGENVFRAYLPTSENVTYYQVSSPFSELYYVSGSSKEQIFKAIHTQNVTKQLNLALNFNIINSVGTFRRQNTDISNYIITGNYATKNKRYKVLAHAIFDKWYNYENGGLLYVSDFTTRLLDRSDLFDVQLLQAQNRVKETGVFVKQYLGFNKKPTGDSLYDKNTPLFNTYLSHTFSYRRQALMYMDATPQYYDYPTVYFDTTYTGDSTLSHLYANEFKLTQVFVRGKNHLPLLYADAGAEHQYLMHRQLITYLSDTLYPVEKERFYNGQYVAKAGLYFNNPGRFTSSLNVFSVFNGYNNADAGGALRAVYLPDSLQTIWLKVSYDKVQPAFHASRYLSNHFIWNNVFEKTAVLNLSAGYNYDNLKTSLTLWQLNNFVYYSDSILPLQFNKPVNVARFAVSKLFKLGAFRLDNNIYLQYSDNQKVIPVPLIVNNHSLYWSTYLFKKALYTQIGTDVYFSSAYYGPRYMPALRQFYTQQQVKTGNYPMIDFFVNINIKRANLFAKLTHLQQGLMGYDYFLVPDYPLQGRAFKFGVSWKFYD